MVAVWPGMGNVAINAGYFLLAKLRMHLESELDARRLFEIGHVQVEHGIIRAGRLPRSRFFRWRNPEQGRDLIVFLGEAQPPSGIDDYCRRIVDHARELGVERIYTFAAMATPMQVADPCRVFVAATTPAAVEEGRKLGLVVLNDARISGLNGVLPELAAEGGIEGVCLLGEMPQVFTQVTYPRSSLGVLKVFLRIAGIEVDLGDLERDATTMDEHLTTLMSRIGEALRSQQEGGPQFPEPEHEDEPSSELSAEDRRRIEELFASSTEDRLHAYQLKKELDRLKVFPEYEDRFLDLFQKSGGNGQPPETDE